MGGISGHTGVARQQITERVWYLLLGSRSGEEHHVDTNLWLSPEIPKGAKTSHAVRPLPRHPPPLLRPLEGHQEGLGWTADLSSTEWWEVESGRWHLLGSWSMPRSTLGASTHSIPLNHLNHHVQETPSPHVHRCRN